MKAPPYKTHTVKQVHLPDPERRIKAIRSADYNLFNLSSSDVYVDLLTDSGTGAMSAEQWAELMKGDESYAGSSSFEELEEYVRDLTGYEYVFPVHQGRAAERILFSVIGEEGNVIPNNTHFDTTRANIAYSGAKPVDFPGGSVIGDSSTLFRGDMDLDRLKSCLEEQSENVPAVISTITNNSLAGLPVSTNNLKGVRELCETAESFFFLDAARFAENAFWNQTKEPSSEQNTIEDIVREQFRTADGCMISAKKDGLVNIGGLLCVDAPELAEEIRTRLILTEGFRTYGGLAGRDLAAMRMGLEEVMDEDYLSYRHDYARELGEYLLELGVPVVDPPSLHAVYVRAGELLDHLPPSRFPGQALAVQLYLEGGIRSVEIGSLMFGEEEENDEAHQRPELIRLALPRRVYTKDHLEFVANTFQRVLEQKKQIPGLNIQEQPEYLRHFTARLTPDGSFPEPLRR